MRVDGDARFAAQRRRFCAGLSSDASTGVARDTRLDGRQYGKGPSRSERAQGVLVQTSIHFSANHRDSPLRRDLLPRRDDDRRDRRDLLPRRDVDRRDRRDLPLRRDDDRRDLPLRRDDDDDDRRRDAVVRVWLRLLVRRRPRDPRVGDRSPGGERVPLHTCDAYPLAYADG